jgi:hypothetical protein
MLRYDEGAVHHLVTERGECWLAPPRVPDATGDRRVVEDRAGRRVAPREEGVDDGARALLANLLFLASRRIGQGALDPKGRANGTERRLGPLAIGFQSFEEVAARS